MFFFDCLHQLFLRIIRVKDNEISAMRHQFVSPFVGEAEHITQHFRLFLVDHSLFGALVENHFDFLLRHGAFFAFQTDEFIQ